MLAKFVPSQVMGLQPASINMESHPIMLISVAGAEVIDKVEVLPHPQVAQGQSLPTPVKINALKDLVGPTDDPDFLDVLAGFEFGFQTYFSGDNLTYVAKNSQMAHQNPEAVAAKLDKEIEADRVIGPFDHPPFPYFRSSPLSIRPKKEEGKFRLLHDLSFPYSYNSVNEGFPDNRASVQYFTIQDAAKLVLKHKEKGGGEVYMCKTDLAHAYRICPISPSDYHLVGFSWEGKFYHDACLPMGLKSACATFTKVSKILAFLGKERFGIEADMYLQ